MASMSEPLLGAAPLDEQWAGKSSAEVAEGAELVARLRASLLLQRLEKLENEIP